MRQRLTINSVDFTAFVAEEGITFGTIPRVQRSVVTLDGTELRKEIVKRSLDVELIETITDAHLHPLVTALGTSPATVIYTDRDGTEKTGTFYVAGLSADAKKVIGATTFYTGVKFALEEK